MILHFAPMDEAAARAIHSWRYEPPYDLYDLADEPLLGFLKAFLDPGNAYYAMFDEAEGLVAYCCFGPDAQVPGGDYGPPAIDVGLGLRPDLTGQRQGLSYVQAVLDFAQRASVTGCAAGVLRTALPAGAADPPPFRVTVAAFNQRAQRVWEKARFRIVQRFERSCDSLPFVVMVRP
jgi:ribosomal-protein-alanine N-acetyltransferase